MGESIPAFKVGDPVEKITGDYRFTGEVRSVFQKRSGAFRYVVENQDGILHVFSKQNLCRKTRPEG